MIKPGSSVNFTSLETRTAGRVVPWNGTICHINTSKILAYLPSFEAALLVLAHRGEWATQAIACAPVSARVFRVFRVPEGGRPKRGPAARAPPDRFGVWEGRGCLGRGMRLRLPPHLEYTAPAGGGKLAACDFWTAIRRNVTALLM
jgi:hypothetical protein